MNDTINLSVVESSRKKLPETCTLCTVNRVLFQYELTSALPGTGNSQKLFGYCCRPCAQSLLAAMEEVKAATRR